MVTLRQRSTSANLEQKIADAFQASAIDVNHESSADRVQHEESEVAYRVSCTW